MFTKVKSWLLSEESIDKSTETGMWVLAGVAAAAGLGWFIVQSLKKSASGTLDNMESTSSSGIDPNAAPAGVGSGWKRN